MSANAFDVGVVALITSDALFVSRVLALLGADTYSVLDANTPIAQIPAGMFPAWVIEQGDGAGRSISQTGDDDGMTIGMNEQQFSSTLELALVWKEQDPATAKAARKALPTLLAQLLMRNPMPGGINGAWLESWEPDRASRHPLHVWRATVRGEYSVPRV